MPKPIPQPEEFGLPLATFLLLQHGSRHLHHCLEQHGGYGDLTPSQFYSLMILDEMQSLPLSKISERIRRSPGNMTMVIDNLEKDGLVERQRSKEDRRVIMIQLTALGREKIETARKVHQAKVEEALTIYTQDELKVLYDLLLRMQPQSEEQHCCHHRRDHS